MGTMFIRKTDSDLYKKQTATPAFDVLEAVQRLAMHLGYQVDLSFDSTLGTGHGVYRLVGASQASIFKFPYNQATADTLSVEDFLYRRLGRDITGVEVIAYDTTLKHFPTPFLLMTEAQGKSFHPRIMTREEVGEIVPRIVSVIARVHQQQISHQGFGLIKAKTLKDSGALSGGFATWKDYLAHHSKEHISFCLNQSLIESYVAVSIERFMEEMLRHPFDFKPCVLHGDLGGHNIILEGNNCAVIDWEDALIGDPLFDYANFASFYPIHLYCDVLLRMFDELYPHRRNTRRLFWMYYLRIAIAKAVARYNLGLRGHRELQVSYDKIIQGTIFLEHDV